MTTPADKIIPLLRRWDHGVHSEHLAAEIVKALGLKAQRRKRNTYDETADWPTVSEISWATPWEPAQCNHPEPPQPPGDFECCASGRCEVCTPGYVWGSS